MASMSAPTASSSNQPHFYQFEANGEHQHFQPVSKENVTQYSALKTLQAVETHTDRLKMNAKTLEYVKSILAAFRIQVDATVQQYNKSWSSVLDKMGITSTGSTLSQELNAEINKVEAVCHRIIGKLHTKEESRVLEILGYTPENVQFVSDLFIDFQSEQRGELLTLIDQPLLQIKCLDPLRKFVRRTALSSLLGHSFHVPIKFLAAKLLKNPTNAQVKMQFVHYSLNFLCGEDAPKKAAISSFISRLSIENLFKWLERLITLTEETKTQLFQEITKLSLPLLSPPQIFSQIDRVLDCFSEEKKERLFPMATTVLTKNLIDNDQLIDLLSLFNDEGREIVLRYIITKEYIDPPWTSMKRHMELVYPGERFILPPSYCIAQLFMKDERLIGCFYHYQTDLLEQYQQHKLVDVYPRTILGSKGQILSSISQQFVFDTAHRLMIIGGLKVIPEDQRAELVKGIPSYFWQESAAKPWKNDVVRQALLEQKDNYYYSGRAEVFDEKEHRLMEQLSDEADQMVQSLQAIPENERAALMKQLLHNHLYGQQ